MCFDFVILCQYIYYTRKKEKDDATFGASSERFFPKGVSNLCASLDIIGAAHRLTCLLRTVSFVFCLSALLFCRDGPRLPDRQVQVPLLGGSIST